MNMDLELTEWRAQWRAEEAAAALPQRDLRALVERKSRNMRLAFAGHMTVGIALMAFSAWVAARHPTFEWMLWAAVIWVSTFVMAGFMIWNAAGTWSALQESNATFLDLARRRTMREWRAVHFGRWALAVQLAIVMAWFSIDILRHRMPVNSFLLGVALVVLMAAAWLLIFTARERRIQRDLAYLNECASDLVQ